MTDILLVGLLIQGIILIYIGAVICGWLDEIHTRLAPGDDEDDDGPDPIVGKFDPMLSPEFDDIA